MTRWQAQCCGSPSLTPTTTQHLQVKDDHLYIVVNAGCREKDLAHIGKHLSAFKARKRSRCVNGTDLTSRRWLQAKGRNVDMHIHDERALLALQGPKAMSALQVRCSVARGCSCWLALRRSGSQVHVHARRCF